MSTGVYSRLFWYVPSGIYSHCLWYFHCNNECGEWKDCKIHTKTIDVCYWSHYQHCINSPPLDLECNPELHHYIRLCCIMGSFWWHMEHNGDKWVPGVVMWVGLFFCWSDYFKTLLGLTLWIEQCGLAKYYKPHQFWWELCFFDNADLVNYSLLHKVSCIEYSLVSQVSMTTQYNLLCAYVCYSLLPTCKRPVCVYIGSFIAIVTLSEGENV